MQNKNVSKLLRLRILRYRQTPNNLKRVKAHAERREPSTLLLVVSANFGDFQNTRSSGRFTICLFYLFCYVTIGSFVFRVLHYYFLNKSMCALLRGSADYVHQIPIFLKSSSLFSYEYPRPFLASSNDCS